jgi:hypothetical protein
MKHRPGSTNCPQAVARPVSTTPTGSAAAARFETLERARAELVAAAAARSRRGPTSTPPPVA